MNGKLNIDAVLREWPSPSGEDHAWEQRAEAIVKAAMARSSSATSDDRTKAEALTAPPALPPEPGEPGGRTSLPGEIKMSDEQSGGSSSQKPASNPPRKKQSLKEIAERASQSGMSRSSGAPSSMAGASSRPATSTPIPSGPLSGWDSADRSTSTPLPSARPSGALSTPLPSARPSMPLSSRPIEAGRDDSGIVDLNTMRATVTAQEKAAAEKARPATHGLIDDDEHEAAPKAVARPALVAVPAKKKGSGGAIAGIAVAVLGLAAAFAVVMISNKKPAPQATQVVPEAPTAAPAATDEAVAAKPAATTEAAAPPESTVAPEAPTAPQAVAMNDPSKSAGPMPTAPEAPAAPPSEASKPATPAPGPATTGTPGNLNEAITKRMGGETGGPAEEKAEPASGPGGKSKSSTVPEQPPQGSVQAAIGSVMGGAKGCVAGADDVSRAQITFSSSGTVSNVSVSGWAAGKGAAGCIKAALKGANVGAFSKPTYTVGITIRP
jgi:hypothetical protein